MSNESPFFKAPPSVAEETKTEEKPSEAPDELAMLKKRADLMGIKYSNNILPETLAKKIEEAMNKEAKENSPAPSATPSPAKDEVATDEEVIEKLPGKVVALSKQQLRRQLQDEYLKLVRLRITNMNPAKADLQGEILTVANRFIGKVSKYVPYGDSCGEDGYHVPYFLYLFMKERKFTQVKTDKNGVPRMSDANEFSLEVMQPLTKKELERLAVKQAAARGTTEAG